MTFPWPWAPYIPTLYIISGIAQYLVHNNLSLWLNCQLLVFPWGLPLVRVTFFQSPRSQMVFFWRPRQCVLKHFNKPKFKISSFLVIQISSDASLSISKVSTVRLQLFIFDFFGHLVVFFMQIVYQIAL